MSGKRETGSFTTGLGGDTIKAVKIIIYILTFAVILLIAASIVALSLAVAPAAAKSSGWGRLAVSLGGLAVAGGVVYLAEKLINQAKGVAQMVYEVITEKYKQRRWEEGRKERQQAWEAWYERQQAAFRAGLPFDEPPPFYAPADHANGKDNG